MKRFFAFSSFQDRRSRLFQGIVSLSLGSCLFAGESLSFPEALKRAGLRGASAEIQAMELRAAQAESQAIRGHFWPELQLTGGHLNLDHEPALMSKAMHLGPIQAGPLTIPPITVPPSEFPLADRHGWRGKVALQYVLYDFGRRSRALEASQIREKGLSLQGRAEIRKGQAQAAAHYLKILGILAQRRVIQERQSFLASHLKDVQALFDNGVVARNDLLRVEVAQRQLLDADRHLEHALAGEREALSIAMGESVAIPFELSDTPQRPPALPWDEASLRRMAAERNESVQALHARTQALEKQLAFKKADFWPAFVAEAAHSYEQNSHMVHNHGNSLYVGLSWKLLDGGTRRAKINGAQAEMEKARRELEEARKKAEATAMAYFRDYQQALQERETAQANVKAGEENLRIVQDQYKEGMVRNTEVLDAESVLADSRAQLSQKHYRAFGAQAALLAVLGEDLHAFYTEVRSR